MRADRLISIIMLLQTRERMTAEELAQELEVSPRTIYRDIYALEVAGIPIYTNRGPGGGITLLESYRTTLTGMREEELQALSMLNVPQALVDLGMGAKLKSALLKLAVTLPSAQQHMQAHLQQRVYLDATAWDDPAAPSPHLGTIHQAIQQDKRIHLEYQGRFETRLEFIAEPIGLVAKMNTWYLVGRTSGFLRVFNMDDILTVRILNEEFMRPDDFDLAEFWAEWCKSTREQRSFYPVRVALTPSLFEKLPFYLGEAVKFFVGETIMIDGQEWRIAIIHYDIFFRARESILNFGRSAWVLEPEALRCSVQDFAQQIVNMYQDR
jgi:predicted DNA-binding transcriptional regulator YafY